MSLRKGGSLASASCTMLACRKASKTLHIRESLSSAKNSYSSI
jgi:hypothetical protein